MLCLVRSASLQRDDRYQRGRQIRMLARDDVGNFGRPANCTRHLATAVTTPKIDDRPHVRASGTARFGKGRIPDGHVDLALSVDRGMIGP